MDFGVSFIAETSCPVMYRFLGLFLLTIGATTASEDRPLTSWRDRQHHVVGRHRGTGFLRMHIHGNEESDETVVLHDFAKRLTAYKDDTFGKCFVTKLQPRPLVRHSLKFRYLRDGEPLPENIGALFVQHGDPVADVEKLAGPKIADLCDKYDTYWVHLILRNGRRHVPVGSKSRRKRWGWSTTYSISVTGDDRLITCFQRETGSDASTNCSAYQTGASSHAEGGYTDGESDRTSALATRRDAVPGGGSNGEANQTTAGSGGWLAWLFGESTGRSQTVVRRRQKRWGFSTSGGISIGSDGVRRCHNVNAGNNSTSRCDGGDTSSSARADDGGKGSIPSQEPPTNNECEGVFSCLIKEIFG